MSGGSYDYAYNRVLDFSHDLDRNTDDSPDLPAEVADIRRQFAAHVRLVAEAMRAVEWVDSSDWSAGDEVEPIRRVLAVQL
jgi:hypothetical protein